VTPLPRNSRWRPKTGSSVILARVVVFEGYLSRLLCFSGRQIEFHHCYLDHNSSWCHISRWRRKSTTTILNLRSSTCKHSKRYVQNWKYFRFVVAILKDWYAVDSNSIYVASVSFTSPKTYDYSLTLLWCEATFAELKLFLLFVRHIYFRCDSDTWRGEYYCHWKDHPYKHRHSSWNFVFMCLRNRITP